MQPNFPPKKAFLIKINKSEGLSLVELLVTTAILGFVALAISTLMLRANDQYAELKNKINYVGYHQLVSNLINHADSCGCNFVGNAFNEGSPGKISLSYIKHSCAPGAGNLLKSTMGSGASDLDVDEIFLSDIVSTGNSNEFKGNLYIKPFTSSKSVQLKLIPLPINFYTDPTTPSSGKAIQGCGKAPLSVPTNLTALAGNGQCSFTWSPSSGGVPIVYNLLRSTTATQAKTGTISCQTSTLSCIVNGLINDTVYYFAIQSANPIEASAFSSEVICTPISPSTVPMGLSATAINSTDCRISWAAAAGSAPITYQVNYSATNGASASGGIGCTTNSYSCDIVGLTSGTTYFFSIRSMNPAGSSSSSGEVACLPDLAPTCGSATMGPPVALAPTTNLCSIGSPSTVFSSGAGHPWVWSCIKAAQSLICQRARTP